MNLREWWWLPLFIAGAVTYCLIAVRIVDLVDAL